MPVAECMQRVSYREYLAWRERFKQEWNTPSRTDYYLMQLAALTIRMRKGSLDNLKIPFKFKSRSSQEGSFGKETMTVELATAIAKARWHARLGVDDRPRR